jgi:PAS domain S-box-containing protein
MSRSLRILMVEDSPDDAALTVKELERGGYQVDYRRVDTFDAMHAALSAERWDLIIADYDLQLLSGMAALQLVRRSGLDLPVIIVSRTLTEDASVEMFRAGAYDCLLKGNLKRLAPAVERALDAVNVRRQWRYAEEALRESEARARAIVETAVDAIITINQVGIIESFNPAAARLFGYTANEAIGRNVNVLMPSRYAEEHDAFVANYVRTGHKRIIGIGREAIGLRQDGSTFPIDLAVSEVRLRDRRLFTGVVRDITERKRAEQALRTSERRFTQFMQHLPGVAFMKDIEGRYVYANESCERLFRRNLAEYIGKTDAEIWPFAVAKQFSDSDQFVVRTGEVLQVTEVVPDDDGPHSWLVTKFPILNDDGAITMVGGAAVDVTERLRAEAELRELQKVSQQRERLADIGAITAQIVHDVGNPLAGISMQAQLILHRARRDEHQPVSTVRKPVEQILAEVRRLDTLIREFMEFSREQRLDVKTIDLSRLLQDVVDLWQPVAAIRAIALSLHTPSHVPPLRADVDKLRRVFDNLVKNAIDAIDRGPGTVALAVTLPDTGRVCISVSDTGPGIPESVQVFRLFETTKADGTGLGLPVVQQIVLAHRGSIDFTRLQPHGTIFRIQLPRGGE